MIAIDSNLLLYAHNSAAPEHPRARSWLEATLSTDSAVGLPLVSILAFLRISTNPRLPKPSYSPSAAMAVVQRWLERDNVSVLEPGERHWRILADVMADSKSSGARVTDAHLAALAIEHGATLCTNDRDFRRFPLLDVRFPLAG